LPVADGWAWVGEGDGGFGAFFHFVSRVLVVSLRVC
jgi:hypothetical protein